MAEQEQEQDRTEEATPFKLRRARERGIVARSLDLGYLGGLVALAGFLIVAGEALAFRLAQLMRQSLAAGISSGGSAQQAAALTGAVYRPALQSIALLGVTILIVVLFVEIVQLRGLFFTTQPLKPDFSRLNPAKGLKRIFSVRMLKEALKNVVKLCLYSAAAALVIRAVIAAPRRAATDAQGLAGAMHADGMRLLFLFIVLALFFAAFDQILVRREYAKQMRMSRRELVREAREREGEPRLKQRRRQLHAEFRKQAEGLGKLPGSDMLIVNPHHVAVALAYDPAAMAAPTVTGKARNHFALAMRREAFRLGIPIFESPALARALFRDCAAGSEIGADHYRAVADFYFKLRSRNFGGEG
jgi:flagellar biosynthetic protein FlhB